MHVSARKPPVISHAPRLCTALAGRVDFEIQASGCSPSARIVSTAVHLEQGQGALYYRGQSSVGGANL